MSTYESLKGLKVKYLSADTSGDRLQEGEIFYNSSDFNLKSHIAVAAWSSAANGLTARGSLPGGFGTQTAAVAAGETGRELFAHVQNAASLNIQPGDFVSVAVREPILENVLKIPSSAASTNGEVLVVNAENRLEEATVEILRNTGNDLIVRANSIEGRKLVIARAPQLGEGIRVNPRAPGGAIIEEKKMITLDPVRRDKILVMLRNNKRMPEPVRNRLIKQFEKGEVLEEVLVRIESRMASTQSGDTSESIKITPDQRKAMIAFIKANENIPEETKIKVLERLKQDRIPKAMFERLSKSSGT